MIEKEEVLNIYKYHAVQIYYIKAFNTNSTQASVALYFKDAIAMSCNFSNVSFIQI